MIDELKSISAVPGLETNTGKTKIFNPESQYLKIGKQTIQVTDEYIYFGHKRSN